MQSDIFKARDVNTAMMVPVPRSEGDHGALRMLGT